MRLGRAATRRTAAVALWALLAVLTTGRAAEAQHDNCLQPWGGGSGICGGNGLNVANLPAAAGLGRIAIIDNGTSATDCTAGGGTTDVCCYETESAWVPCSGALSGYVLDTGDVMTGPLDIQLSETAASFGVHMGEGVREIGLFHHGNTLAPNGNLSFYSIQDLGTDRVLESYLDTDTLSNAPRFLINAQGDLMWSVNGASPTGSIVFSGSTFTFLSGTNILLPSGNITSTVGDATIGGVITGTRLEATTGGTDAEPGLQFGNDDTGIKWATDVLTLTVANAGGQLQLDSTRLRLISATLELDNFSGSDVDMRLSNVGGQLQTTDLSNVEQRWISADSLEGGPYVPATGYSPITGTLDVDTTGATPAFGFDHGEATTNREIGTLYRGTGQAPNHSLSFYSIQNATTDRVLESYIYTDTLTNAPRFVINAAGNLYWSPATGASPDTSLSWVTGKLQIDTRLSLGTGAAATPSLQAGSDDSGLNFPGADQVVMTVASGAGSVQLNTTRALVDGVPLDLDDLDATEVYDVRLKVINGELTTYRADTGAQVAAILPSAIVGGVGGGAFVDEAGDVMTGTLDIQLAAAGASFGVHMAEGAREIGLLHHGNDLTPNGNLSFYSIQDLGTDRVLESYLDTDTLTNAPRFVANAQGDLYWSVNGASPTGNILFSGSTFTIGSGLTNNLSVTGTIASSSTVTGTRLISTVADGTAPLAVTSTTKVANLNVDRLDDTEASAFALLAGRAAGQTLNGGTAASEDLTLSSTANATKGHIYFGTSGYDQTQNFLGINDATPSYSLDVAGDIRSTAQIRSTLADGTAPMVITSTTKVANLNVDRIDDLDSTAFVATAGDVMTGTLDIQLSIAAASYGVRMTEGAREIGLLHHGNDLTPNGNLSFYSVQDLGTDRVLESYLDTDTLTNAPRFLVNAQGDLYWSVNGASPTGNILFSGSTFTIGSGLTNNLSVTGTIASSSTVTGTRLISTVADGTAPLAVTSTTKVANLNVDRLDDTEASAFALLAGRAAGQTLNGGTAASEDLTLSSTANATKGHIYFGTSGYDQTQNFLGINDATPSYSLDVAGDIRSTAQIRSTLADGTAPMVITSTTKVANLNVDRIDDLDSTAFVATAGDVMTGTLDIQLSIAAASYGVRMTEGAREIGLLHHGNDLTPNGNLSFYSVQDLGTDRVLESYLDTDTLTNAPRFLVNAQGDLFWSINGASPLVTLAFDGSNTLALGDGDNLALAGAGNFTMGATGQIAASTKGVKFTHGDANQPTCAGAGDFAIWADDSEGKLKKCQDGTPTDLDTSGGGGAPTTAQYLVAAADAGLSLEKVLTAGTAIDVVITAGDGTAATVSVDSTEAGFVAEADLSASCGAATEGKVAVYPGATAIQYCSGDGSYVAGFLDADGADDDEPDGGDFGNLVAGDGIARSTATLSTASTEAHFLADGGTSTLACASTNYGKVQVMDDGGLHYCDGAATPILRKALNSAGTEVMTGTLDISLAETSVAWAVRASEGVREIGLLHHGTGLTPNGNLSFYAIEDLGTDRVLETYLDSDTLSNAPRFLINAQGDLFWSANAAAPFATLSAPAANDGLSLTADTALTNATSNLLALRVATSGTAAAFLGGDVDWYLENAAASDELAGTLRVRWDAVTSGSEEADVVIYAMDNGQALAAEHVVYSYDGADNSTTISAVLQQQTIAAAPTNLTAPTVMRVYTNPAGKVCANDANRTCAVDGDCVASTCSVSLHGGVGTGTAVSLEADNTVGTQTPMAQLAAVWLNATAGSNVAQLLLQARANPTMTTLMSLDSTNGIQNEIDTKFETGVRFDEEAVVTIGGTDGELAVTQVRTRAAAATGTADELNSLPNSRGDGAIVILRADTGDTITVTSEYTGTPPSGYAKIQLDRPQLELTGNDQLTLLYDSTAARWLQIASAKITGANAEKRSCTFLITQSATIAMTNAVGDQAYLRCIPPNGARAVVTRVACNRFDSATASPTNDWTVNVRKCPLNNVGSGSGGCLEGLTGTPSRQSVLSGNLTCTRQPTLADVTSATNEEVAGLNATLANRITASGEYFSVWFAKASTVATKGYIQVEYYVLN